MNAASLHAYPRRAHRQVRIWFPLTILVWLILLPLAVIAAPLVFVGALIWRLNPFAAVGTMFSLLIALCGVRIDIDTPDARVTLF